MGETVMGKELNPGSKEAIEWGCTCPIKDNRYGKGHQRHARGMSFWVSGDCPLHTNIWGKRQYPDDPLDKKLVMFLDELGKESWENIARTGVATNPQYAIAELRAIFESEGWEEKTDGIIHVSKLTAVQHAVRHNNERKGKNGRKTTTGGS